MAKRKEINNRIFILFLWFLLTGLLLTTSTYAWFSTNRIVHIDFFEVHVATDGGIQISADGSDWKTVIEIQELTSVHNTTYPTSVNQIPSEMRPVSTGGNVDLETGFLEMYYGIADNNAENELILSATRAVEEEGFGMDSLGHYIAFDVFFKSNSEKQVFLSKESYVEHSDDVDKGIENASRVAFLKQGSMESNASLNAIQNMRGATNNDVYIWEPNYDTHVNSGVRNAYSTYGIMTYTMNATRINYDGIISEINRENNVLIRNATNNHYPNYFKDVNINVATKKVYDMDMELFEINEGITKIRIYMWLEGQDVDCENEAASSNMAYFLQFVVNNH